MPNNRKTKVAPPEDMSKMVAKNIQVQETEPMTKDQENSLPKKLGRYPILRLLAHGGMGSVYLAYDQQLEREVAIKTIKKKFADTKYFRDRFTEEAKLAAAIEHPNIVKVYDWGTDLGEGNFIVMEYVRGETIHTRIKRSGPMEVKSVVLTLAPLVDALCAMNRKHIVHRDIKPGNILLSESGVVKLTDLGIAKSFSNQSDKKKTQGVSPGTPDFMAPEQRKTSHVDIRADIYSLGKTLCFMVGGPNGLHLARAEEFEGLVPAKESHEDTKESRKIFKNVIEIILKMAEEDPNKRYQTPENVKKDINDMLAASDVGKKIKIPVIAFLSNHPSCLWIFFTRRGAEKRKFELSFNFGKSPQTSTKIGKDEAFLGNDR